MYKYSIGDLKFKTKKDCEAYARNIIYSLGCCKITKTHTEYNFFNDLIKNNSDYTEKIGTGIDYFYIIKNPNNYKALQTMIHRTDNTEAVFGWKHCCNLRIPTAKQNLTKAMREAIKEQTMEFKRSNNLICSYCKIENEQFSEYHVDHDEPSFKTLTENFLKTKQHIPNKFNSCKTTYTTIFKDEDKEFKDEWFNYHLNNCKLQILCKTCNLKKH